MNAPPSLLAHLPVHVAVIQSSAAAPPRKPTWAPDASPPPPLPLPPLDLINCAPAAGKSVFSTALHPPEHHEAPRCPRRAAGRCGAARLRPRPRGRRPPLPLALSAVAHPAAAYGQQRAAALRQQGGQRAGWCRHTVMMPWQCRSPLALHAAPAGSCAAAPLPGRCQACRHRACVCKPVPTDCRPAWPLPACVHCSRPTAALPWPLLASANESRLTAAQPCHPGLPSHP